MRELHEKDTEAQAAEVTGEVSQLAFVIALLLSVVAALAPWFFPSENTSYDLGDMLMTFAGAFTGVLSVVGFLKKVVISRRAIYVLLIACCTALALLLIPPRSPKWQQQWQELDNATSEQAGLAERLDLSRVRSLRLTFDPSQAGDEFQLRLVPENASADSSVGISRETFSIPDDGMVTLPLRARDFGLTREDLRQLVQVAVLPARPAPSPGTRLATPPPPPASPSPSPVSPSPSPAAPPGHLKPAAPFKKIEILTGNKNQARASAPRQEIPTPLENAEKPPAADAEGDALPKGPAQDMERP